MQHFISNSPWEDASLIAQDVFTKQERVYRTLNFLPVNRVAIHDQVSWNSGVISLYTGKDIKDFDYTLEDIGEAAKKSLDTCFPLFSPYGTNRVTTEDGFTIQYDNWTSWIVKRPFNNTKGLREYYLKEIGKMRNSEFDAEKVRTDYREEFLKLQKLIGDTVLINWSHVGFCNCWSKAGLNIFTYLYYEEPEIISQYLEVCVENEIRRVHAVADKKLSPVILIPEDLASKQGPIFSPSFLKKEFFPRLARLIKAWHSHGIKVIYHSDGNWKKLIPIF